MAPVRESNPRRDWEMGLSPLGSKDSTQLAGKAGGRPDPGQGDCLPGSGQGHRHLQGSGLWGGVGVGTTI